MPEFDLAIRGGTVVTAADTLRAEIGIRDGRIVTVAERVAAVTRQHYPALRVPYHSRWRHFDLDRLRALEERLLDASVDETSRCQLDLVVTSVGPDPGSLGGLGLGELRRFPGRRLLQ